MLECAFKIFFNNEKEMNLFIVVYSHDHQKGFLNDIHVS